ncbi:MAG: transcriptional regulator [Alteromonadaceae bacterium]|nr:transcriptional regulator [Alteromonadaceae bacterium]
MAKQYWIGEFYVDLSRNQISQPGISHNVPPKALQVLTYLAQKQGAVVSYDELLNEVWPNTIVTPNTLQRCIAHLRKALGENRQAQTIIKTHAKQGYSLECEVKWSELVSKLDDQAATESTLSSVSSNSGSTIDTATVTDENIENIAHDDSPQINHSSSDTSEKLTHSNRPSGQNWMLGIAFFALLLLMFVFTQKNDESTSLEFTELRPLTATDDKEFGATYSLDGEFILFNRFDEEFCINNIWAKHNETFEERQLTVDMGTYEGHDLSPDGKMLVFIKQNDCTTPLEQSNCYQLMSQPFDWQRENVSTPEALLECQQSPITSPIWIDNAHIVMKQRSEGHWRLVRYSLTTQSSDVLYQIEDGHVSSYDWSAEQQLFAVSSLKSDGKQYIEMLHVDGQIKSSHPIVLPADSPTYLKISPRFTPTRGEMIFSFGSELFTLSERGDVNKLKVPFDTYIDSADFHPNGDRMLMVKGNFDSDIGSLDFGSALNDNTLSPNVFARSTAMEQIATYRPNSDTIAYVSAQTGTEQVWLQDGWMQDSNGVKVVSKLPNGSFIQNLLWSDFGESLLVFANWQIHILTLSDDQSDLAKIDFPHLVNDVFHWNNEANTVLASIMLDGVRTFVRIDLASLEFDIVNRKKVKWAAQSHDGAVIYMDDFERFWQPHALEDKLITALDGQGSNKRFIIRDGIVYGINRSEHLWSYSLLTDEFRTLGSISQEVEYLTDIKHQQALITLKAHIKKEIIELSLK